MEETIPVEPGTRCSGDTSCVEPDCGCPPSVEPPPAGKEEPADEFAPEQMKCQGSDYRKQDVVHIKLMYRAGDGLSTILGKDGPTQYEFFINLLVDPTPSQESQRRVIQKATNLIKQMFAALRARRD